VKTLQGRIAKRKGGQIRNYKKEYANYQSRPEQKKNRAKRNAARRSLLQSGRVHKGDGKDVDHKDGNPQNNSPNNLLVKSKSNNRSFSRKGYAFGDLVKGLKQRYTKAMQGVAEAANIDHIGMWDQGNVTAKAILGLQKENIGRDLKLKPYTEAEIEPIAEIARHIDIAGSAARKNPTRDMPRNMRGPYGDISPEKRPAITNPNRTLLQGKEIWQAAIGKGIKDSRKDWGNNKIGFTLGQQNLQATEDEWQEIIRNSINDSLQRNKQGLDPREGVDVVLYE